MNIEDLRNLIPETYKHESSIMDLSMDNRIIKSGLGFFPYGSGLLLPDSSELPTNGLMVVGQDFGDVDYITPEIIQNGEANKPTFRKMTTLINDYPKEKVFLTNLFMGLRKEKGMIGDNPALKNKDKNAKYLNASIRFFNLQLEYINPEKIIVLGKATYNFMCSEFDANSHKVDTFDNYLAKVKEKQFLSINNVLVLCIPHPSMWNSNVKNQDEWKEIITQFIV